jgi:hypothetical protein
LAEDDDALVLEPDGELLVERATGLGCLGHASTLAGDGAPAKRFRPQRFCSQRRYAVGSAA